MIPLMAARRRPRDTRFPMGSVFERSFLDAEMTLKEVAYTMGYPDPSQIAKAIDGQAPLDLWEMGSSLPLRFWVKFIANLMKALLLFWYEDVQSRQMVKATVPTERKEKAS